MLRDKILLLSQDSDIYGEDQVCAVVHFDGSLFQHEISSTGLLDTSYVTCSEVDYLIDTGSIFYDHSDIACIHFSNRNIPDGGGFYPQVQGNEINLYNSLVFYDKDAVVSFFGIEIPDVVTNTESLNGNGCEFKDGSHVMVDGRDTVFEVKLSSFFLLDDASYTVLYELTSPTGETLRCPESLLSRYVPPVTTP